MKIAFISDIHGNATALDSVIKDINSKSVDKVYVLGDICFRGPDPQRSLDIVRSLETEVIKGNTDEWVVRGIEEAEVSEKAFSMMVQERDWIYSKLDKKSIRYLENLPTDLKLEYDGIKIHAFHATPENLFEIVPPYESDENINKKMMASEADIFVYAHIHKPFIRFVGGKCIANTGSVGLPFDGIDKSSYLLLDIQDDMYQISIVRVPYDVQSVINQFNDSDYPYIEMMTRILNNAKV